MSRDPITEGGGSRHGTDMRAAYMGLFVGLLVLLAIVYGIVRWTDSRFEGHEPAPGASTPH